MDLNQVFKFLQSEFRTHEKNNRSWEFERIQFRNYIVELEASEKHLKLENSDLRRRILMLENVIEQERKGNSIPLPALVVALPVKSSKTLIHKKSKQIISSYLNQFEHLFKQNVVICETDALISHVSSNEPKVISQNSESKDQNYKTVKRILKVKKSSAASVTINNPMKEIPNDHPTVEDISKFDHESHADKFWKVKGTVRAHLDLIRKIQVHPHEPFLVTASEDGTAKLFDLKPFISNKHPAEIESTLTFRGHSGPVLSVCISGENVITGGADSAIYAFSMNKNEDQFVPPSTLIGHSNSVWDIQAHPKESLFASCSADGTVKLWDSNDFALKHNIINKPFIPTSIQWINDNPNWIIIAYQNSISIYDIEAGKTVLNFQDGPETTIQQVKLSSLSIVASGREDHSIAFHDIKSGKLVYSMKAHTDGVGCLDFHPSGKVLVSAGHDCSVKWWDMSTFGCIQEHTSHKRKMDEGIWDVAYFPNHPFLITAGADSTLKLYT